MPRRTAPPDPSIGDRIRSRRELHGWSIRHAASRAGVAHSTWSRIEHGTLGTDNRFILAKVAEALECSSDLAQTVPPTDADSVAAYLGVSAVRQALIETDLDEVGSVVPRPLTVLAADVELATDLKLRCDYAGAVRFLPGVLRELHAAAQGPGRAEALALLVRAAVEAADVTKSLGFPAEAWLASERAHQAAIALEDSVMLALAAWSRGHSASSCGAHDRALRLTDAAIPQLERSHGRPGGLEMLGATPVRGVQPAGSGTSRRSDRPCGRG
jgi:transcriptional regulator with XRE-family HTH domain